MDMVRSLASLLVCLPRLMHRRLRQGGCTDASTGVWGSKLNGTLYTHPCMYECKKSFGSDKVLFLQLPDAGMGRQLAAKLATSGRLEALATTSCNSRDSCLISGGSTRPLAYIRGCPGALYAILVLWLALPGSL
jgi:hypothetical protein